MRLRMLVLVVTFVLVGCSGGAAPHVAEPGKTTAEIVAHRGGKPENTLSAFKAALANPNVGAIELDVQVSKDGELFVIHDKTVDRTTTGKGEIAALTAAEMRQLQTPKEGAEPIPTLDEVLALAAAAPDKRIFVEIKEPTPADTPAKVLTLLAKHKVAERSIVTSFDRSLVEATRKLDPKQATGFISKTFDKAEIAYAGEYLLIAYKQVSRDKLEQAHKAGKKVYVWTVNEKMSMETYLRMGVDGVISDEYRLLAEARQGLK